MTTEKIIPETIRYIESKIDLFRSVVVFDNDDHREAINRSIDILQNALRELMRA
jgi:hypothetical protein